jgi:hypothetical protein
MIWILPAAFAAYSFAQLGALSVWVTVLSFAVKALILIVIATALAIIAKVAWVRGRR